jgi:hypothetical protein
MKPKTRDNLIYLAIGLSIAGVVAGLFFYADSHGQVPVFPSRFKVRLVTTMLLVAYFVARAARRVNSTLAGVAVCVLVAGLLPVAISFSFRQIIGQLPGIPYAGFAAIEIFFIVELIERTGSYLRRMAHSGRAKS